MMKYLALELKAWENAGRGPSRRGRWAVTLNYAVLPSFDILLLREI